eukprot:2941001-Alexandrium_andersonii.AAC.1
MQHQDARSASSCSSSTQSTKCLAARFCRGGYLDRTAHAPPAAMLYDLARSSISTKWDREG